MSVDTQCKGILLVVFGGRKYPYRYTLWNYIHDIIDGVPMDRVKIMHGCATGADSHAHAFCEQWKHDGLIEVPVPAKWEDLTARGAVIRERNGRKYNVRAGYDRNQEMVDRKPTHALGAPGGTGTADMWRRIKHANDHGAGIKITRIE